MGPAGSFYSGIDVAKLAIDINLWCLYDIIILF